MFECCEINIILATPKIKSAPKKKNEALSNESSLIYFYTLPPWKRAETKNKNDTSFAGVSFVSISFCFWIGQIKAYKKGENVLGTQPVTANIQLQVFKFPLQPSLSFMMFSQHCCIRCKEPVRPRQERLQCDGCKRWPGSYLAGGFSLNLMRAI